MNAIILMTNRAQLHVIPSVCLGKSAWLHRNEWPFGFGSIYLSIEINVFLQRRIIGYIYRILCKSHFLSLASRDAARAMSLEGLLNFCQFLTSLIKVWAALIFLRINLAHSYNIIHFSYLHHSLFLHLQIDL